MYRVLVPVDDDEDRAAAQVETLLSLPGAAEELSVTALHVYEDLDVSTDEAGATRVEDLDESLPDLQDTSATVALVEERLAETAVAVSRREMIGSPAETINRVATAVDADAILLGVRKRSPVGKAVFGSVSQQVILGADRPVIIAD